MTLRFANCLNNLKLLYSGCLSTGALKIRHTDYKTVMAVPYDVPILGYDTVMVDMLRLWSARSPKTIDMATAASTPALWRKRSWPR